MRNLYHFFLSILIIVILMGTTIPILKERKSGHPPPSEMYKKARAFSGKVSTVIQDSLPQIERLELVNVENQEILATFDKDTVIGVTDLDLQKMTLRVISQPDTIGSVWMDMRGEITHQQQENLLPYTLFGDKGNSRMEGQFFPEGNYEIRLKAYSEKNRGGDSAQVKIVRFTIYDDYPVYPLLRINAGGQLYQDQAGESWQADRHFEGGLAGFKNIGIKFSEDDLLYQSYHLAYSGRGQLSVGTPFSYKIPVSGPGPYTIRLHFIEPYFGYKVAAQRGQRIFDVSLEGKTILEDFEPFYEHQEALRPIVKEFRKIQIRDQFIDLEFVSKNNNALISAIEVFKEDRPAQAEVIKVQGTANNEILDGAENIYLDENFSTELWLPNGGVDRNTLKGDNVYLLRKFDQFKVPIRVNSTGGGDAITIVPRRILSPEKEFEIVITDQVKDTDGRPFISQRLSFRTGKNVMGQSLPGLKFQRIHLKNTAGANYSSVTIGPDRKLYASTLDGFIKRFDILDDGRLSDPETIFTLRNHRRGEEVTQDEKIIVGFTFAPWSRADDLEVWITYAATYEFQRGPNWDCNIARLKGSQLEELKDMVIHLPRSTKDHLSNSLAFGPDEKLYMLQGGNTAMGRADITWNRREENLLSAALLSLDTRLLSETEPLDAKTGEDGQYNPYLPDAPLQIYATGIRNAYDLLWHSNGELYVPANGSAAGGNTPTSDPEDSLFVPIHSSIEKDTSGQAIIPALNQVAPTQSDWLYRIKKGGYYGHPNPKRGEYILNRGFRDVNDDRYATQAADSNFDEEGLAYDFQNNKSPNGVIEYKSNTFGGLLQGMIMVVRYSQNDDIIMLEPGGANHNIVNAYVDVDGKAGLRDFFNPIDLVEDPLNGNIYVAELGQVGDYNGSIQLLKSNDNVPRLSLENRDELPGNEDLTFSRIQIPWQNYRQGPNFNANHDLVTLRMHNLGKVDLEIEEFTLSNPDYWEIAYLERKTGERDSSWTYPYALAPGDHLDVVLKFVAVDPPGARSGRIKILHEQLIIRSNDPGFPLKEINLHGLWQKEGEDFREPRLQEVIEAFGWTTQVGFTKNNNGADTSARADEVIARYFRVANPDEPVLIRQIAAYHGCCHEPELTYYNDVDPESSIQGTLIMVHLDLDGQSLFPRLNKRVADGRWGRPAQKLINPSDVFSLINRRGSSNFNMNYPSREDPLTPGYISHRIYQLKDKDGRLVQNTYLIAQDYTGSSANNDYNDNVFYVSNVIPQNQLGRQSQAKNQASNKEKERYEKVIDLQLHPNPNPNQGEIKGLESLDLDSQIEMKIQLMDGRVVYQDKIPYRLFQDQITKRLQDLKTGTYLIQVIHREGVTSKKFMIK